MHVSGGKVRRFFLGGGRSFLPNSKAHKRGSMGVRLAGVLHNGPAWEIKVFELPSSDTSFQFWSYYRLPGRRNDRFVVQVQQQLLLSATACSCGRLAPPQQRRPPDSHAHTYTRNPEPANNRGTCGGVEREGCRGVPLP